MATFFIITLIITVGAIATLLPSLFKKKLSADPENRAQRDNENIQIARDRLAEISQMEVESSSEYQQAQTELEAALLDDLNQSKTTQASRASTLPKAWAIVILLLIPAVSISLYTFIGNPKFIAHTPAPNDEPIEEQDIGRLLAQLERKISENPTNPDGWGLAANTYMTMGDFSKARQAYATLYQLVGDDPDVLTAWSDAIIMDSGNSYVSEAQKNVDLALKLNPDHINALWIAGLGNQSLGNHERAVRHLKRLMPLMADDPQAQEQIKVVLADSLTQVASVSDGLNEADASSNSIVQAKPKQPTHTDGPFSTIQLKISISPELTADFQNTDTIFVVAKATQGPPIPLAVNKLSDVLLPLEVILDDSMSMLPTHKISDFEEVKVSARISKSGQAIRQAGDLISSEVVLKVDGNQQLVELVIDNRVK
ncbi:MAG: c-type cytochrome biogenesis protein CcmI [Gammaproteobacteria bacterium]|nr:c-type cytochrome biogenesis protein CcmI [Gammaproteobacteria bacterium]